WKLMGCLEGQSEDDMVEFDAGEDPSSLIDNLKKKVKITPHAAVDKLKPPADHMIANKEEPVEESADALAKADKHEHPVETQWHHQPMTFHGFVPKNKTATGLVRSYEYEHPAGHKIKVTTGYSSDYWEDKTTGKQGGWRELEPHLHKLNLPVK